MGPEGEERLVGGGGVDGIEVSTKKTRHGFHQPRPLHTGSEGGREGGRKGRREGGRVNT